MALRFVKTQSQEPAASYIAGKLRSHLEAGERVLWLVSGGSVLRLAAAVARSLADAPLGQLTVSLTDERPGPVDHPDSNWRGLMGTGFSLPRATLHPVLTGDGTKSETAAFNRFLREQLERADYSLGVFGIGPDGHTAGLPATHAAPSNQLADYYEAGSFRRISSTPEAISRLHEAVAFVMGEAKHPQLERFAQALPYEDQSAQALKLCPRLTIFNDYQGDPA